MLKELVCSNRKEAMCLMSRYGTFSATSARTCTPVWSASSTRCVSSGRSVSLEPCTARRSSESESSISMSKKLK